MRVLFLACVFSGCGLFSQPVASPESLQFGGELQLCVAKAVTRQEADACRAAVEKKYAPLTGRDAGAE